MEVVNPCCSLLSNFEVMETLQNIKDTKSKFGLRNLATITYETIRFLEDGVCKTQSKEKIIAFLTAVKPFKLTKAECLMMVNDPPTTPLHIQLLVDDSEERLTEEEVTQLIEIAKQFLLPHDQGDE